MKNDIGKVITARGPVEPAALGKVLMHEHLHSDCFDWQSQSLVEEEKPIAPARRELLMREAIPPLRACNEHGCHAYVEVTPAPWRAWPTFMVEASMRYSMPDMATNSGLVWTELSSPNPLPLARATSFHRRPTCTCSPIRCQPSGAWV